MTRVRNWAYRSFRHCTTTARYVQARFYSALAQVLRLEAAEDAVGFYLWNWNGDGPGTAGYSPQGKLAEAHVAHILRRR